VLPEDRGLILADSYGAVFVRAATQLKLAAARRKTLTLRMTRQALFRLRKRDL